MKLKVKDIYGFIDDFAPFSSQADWDNSGLQIGDMETDVNGVLLSLDLDEKTVDMAIENKINTIITHHPMFFASLKKIDYSDYKGRLVKKAVLNDINVIAAHTNLDLSEIGVNYKLGLKLDLYDTQPFKIGEDIDFGIYGNIDTVDLKQLKENISSALNMSEDYIRVYGKQIDDISKIAICGGSGSELISSIGEYGIDVLITADTKYHDGQFAYENNLMILDIGHFYSERPILYQLKSLIENKYEGIKVEIKSDSEYIIL